MMDTQTFNLEVGHVYHWLNAGTTGQFRWLAMQRPEVAHEVLHNRTCGWMERIYDAIDHDKVDAKFDSDMKRMHAIRRKMCFRMSDGDFANAADAYLNQGDPWPVTNPDLNGHSEGSHRAKTEKSASKIARKTKRSRWARIGQWDYPQYLEYLKSPEWDTVRQACFTRDGRACVICSRTDALRCHHRTYVRLGSEMLADVSTLCNACHMHAHKRLGLMVPWMPRRGY